MNVNRKYLRIFLIFLVFFGAYQIYDILTIKDPGVSQAITAGAIMLIAVVMGSAMWFLYNTRR